MGGVPNGWFPKARQQADPAPPEELPLLEVGKTMVKPCSLPWKMSVLVDLPMKNGDFL